MLHFSSDTTVGIMRKMFLQGIKTHYWIIAKCTFEAICLICTFIFIVRGIDRYLDDNDVTIIETESYKDNNIDIMPAISLCFPQEFKDSTFQKLGFNVTGQNYKKFLVGEYFDKSMLSIGYDDVTTNISEYLIQYAFGFNNDTYLYNITQNILWKAPYSTFSWKNWEYFVKCFTLEITNVSVYEFGWELDRGIFPNGTRSQSGGFATLFHYPNQILASINSMTRIWPTKTSEENYWMEFDIKGMNVFHWRYKAGFNNCVREWRNYDALLLERRIESVGCRTPYQSTKHNFPICDSQEKMRKTNFKLHTAKLPPCRTIEKIDYQESETHPKQGEILQIQGKSWRRWFGIYLRFNNDGFTTTISKKAQDFESLIGYIGGYVGLFVGFAVAEIPGMLKNCVIGMKSLYLVVAPHGEMKTSTILLRGREVSTFPA